ncbi:Cullin family-domain-containing protein [Zychaea mexicana]|uniref:Cullin family-domain-containing protein n=1 Tax=Zychaea mexicana TaxID=64656 RepID=UPI0022FDC8A5|nr:Cullin family-domain-containing protein [Zychaea mexicana]KAI9488135.1 Cullin family-domain-containing protein [Zychaea mexicana]
MPMEISRNDSDLLRKESIVHDSEFDDASLVKNLKVSVDTASHDEYFKIAWEDNHKVLIAAILNGEHQHMINFQAAYELSTNICQRGRSKELYELLYNELVVYFDDLNALLNDEFLKDLEGIWIKKKEQLTHISQIFYELDRGYILKNTPYRSIVDLGLALLKKYIIQQPLVKERIITNLLFLIQRDRKGRAVDTDMLTSVTQILIDLGLYKSDFEPRFLESMSAYYKQEAQRLLSMLSARDFVLYTKLRQMAEESGECTYLLSSTRHKLSKIVVNKWIQEKIEILVSRGFYQMLDSNDLPSLHIIYNACSSEEVRGESKIEDYNDSNGIKLLKFLIKFKSKLEDTVNDAMESDSSLKKAIGNAFGELLRDHEQEISRLLVQFIDLKLRSAGVVMKTKQQQQNEQMIIQGASDQALSMFRHFKKKDVFEIFYRASLTQRLLLRASQTDHEIMILKGLASECGPEYTKTMYSMIKDIDTSQDLCKQFFASNNEHNATFEITTLEKMVWTDLPSKKGDELLPAPAELVPHLDAYAEFYATKFTNRKLQWAHSLGTATLVANFVSGAITIVVNFAQAQILLHFNNSSKRAWSLDELASNLSIDKATLQNSIEPLCQKKHPILIKNTLTRLAPTADQNSMKIEDGVDDGIVTFEYNALFSSREKHIVVCHVEDPEEQRKLENRVWKLELNDNRKYQLDAAIMRIMKKRRKLKHAELAAELPSYISFSVAARELQPAVASLISRGFLSRSGATWVYTYNT